MSLPPENNNLHKLCTAPAPAPAPLYRCIVVSLFSTRRSMNNPKSSHMGGIWEGLIRTLRSILAGLGKLLDLPYKSDKCVGEQNLHLPLIQSNLNVAKNNS